MQSLDPRISRLNIPDGEVPVNLQKNPDQFVTFEVFLQRKENMTFEHVGIVHAPDATMALVLAKEQFSRRSTCSGMMVSNTKDVLVSPYTDHEEDIYDQTNLEVPFSLKEDESKEAVYSVFHLTKRGKQHKYVGAVEADNFDDAFQKASVLYREDKPVLNVWLIKNENLTFVSDDDKDIWSTLPDKGHREVTSYRAKDKIDSFKSGTK